MHVVGCSSCEAKVTPSNWTAHQKTLHCSALNQASICSSCLFQSKVFGDSLSHALLEGHEMPTISALNLSGLPIPVGPQRIPVAHKSIPPANNTFSANHSPGSLKYVEQFSNKTENLPLQSLHRLEQEKTRLDTSLSTEPLTTYSQEISMEESDSELQILIRDDASDFGTSHPKSPDEPPESEEVMLQEDNAVESFLVESLAMMAEERPDSTDIDIEEITSFQDVTSHAVPQDNGIVREHATSTSTIDETTIESTSRTNKLTPLISLETNLTAKNVTIPNCESETNRLPQGTPYPSETETSDTTTSNDTNSKPIQSARCTNCHRVLRFRRTSAVIRHVLGCKSIRPYSCSVCQDSWHTVLPAKRHLSNCTSAKIFLRDPKQAEQATWNALHECFPGLPVIWSGRNKTQGTPAKTKETETFDSQDSVDINRNSNQYATKTQEMVLQTGTKSISQSTKLNHFITVDAVVTNTECETEGVPEESSCRSEENIGTRNGTTSHGRRKLPERPLESSRCAKCSSVVKYRNPSIIIRHVLNCQSIRPYTCKACEHSWPTILLANQHVSYCRSGEVFLHDRQQSEQATWKALNACFPGLPVAWNGLTKPNKMNRNAAITEERETAESREHFHKNALVNQDVAQEHFTANPSPRQNIDQSRRKCARCFRIIKDCSYYCKRHVILCLNLYPYQCNACKQPFRSKEQYSERHIGCKPGSEWVLIQNEKEHEEAVLKGLRQCFPGQERRWTKARQTYFQVVKRNGKESTCARCFTQVQHDTYNIVMHVMKCRRIRPYRCTGCDWQGSRRDNAGNHLMRCVPGAELVMEDEAASVAEIRAAISDCFPQESVAWKGF